MKWTSGLEGPETYPSFKFALGLGLMSHPIQGATGKVVEEQLRLLGFHGARHSRGNPGRSNAITQPADLSLCGTMKDSYLPPEWGRCAHTLSVGARGARRKPRSPPVTSRFRTFASLEGAGDRFASRLGLFFRFASFSGAFVH